MTVDADADPEIVAPSVVTFEIDGKELYVPGVTLSKENDTKLLEQSKTGFKRTIEWNKYRSQMTVQPQNNNWNYLIDPIFANVNKLFVLSFARTNAGDKRGSFSHYYVPNVRIRDFNVLIDGSLFDLPVKNEEGAYEEIIVMSNNNDYTTRNLLFFYFKTNLQNNCNWFE